MGLGCKAWVILTPGPWQALCLSASVARSKGPRAWCFGCYLSFNLHSRAQCPAVSVYVLQPMPCGGGELVVSMS